MFISAAAPAHAGIWAWGCQGTLGAPDQTVVFNRYQMVVLDGKKRPVELKTLLDDRTLNNLIAGDVLGYDSNNVNSGFDEKTIVFTRDNEPKGKITLTEVSSQKLKHRQKRICGRDDITDTFRKVYRYERDGEKPRTIAMQCIEYVLTTSGGRRSCDD